ncbi:MAG: rod shape-determining protein [Clostridia bacterium]|nr:rod shape-determining protein [Clostridia bacterium]MBR4972913.1 rod shape-determining protein [Clostridia bacterium]
MATEIGIDLGTSKTVIFSSSKVVLELPNIVTVDSETYEPIYFGEKAKQTLGRTPDSLCCISPIERGVIADYDIAENMIKNYMEQAFGNKILRPRIMATLPPGLTELQHHSLANAVESAGGRNISVIESPLAIAFGLGLDFETPHGTLIVDIGAGTTDIAVISLGGIAACESFKTASLDFDANITKYIRKEYNIEIGPLTAEAIKIKVGSAVERDLEIAMVAKGRNVFTGLPESFEITTGEVYEAIIDAVDSICDAIRKVLQNTDPDLVADIIEDGLYLAGGGSMLYGMDKKISDYLQIPVHKLPDPAYSVVKGAAVALKKPELLKNVDYQLRSIKELVVE